MRNLFLIISLFTLTLTHNAFGQYYTKAKTPQRIIINLTATPSESMAVAWRTIEKIDNAEVQIAEATDWTEFVKNVRSLNPISKKVVTDKDFTVYHHSAIMDELKPNKTYVYRVGGDSIWSEWNQFKTAQDKEAPFKFVFMGDPQSNIKEHCSRVFRQAFKTAPNAAFWLIPGDLTTTTKDYEYDEFFDAGGFIFGTTPSIFTADGHDMAYILKDGEYTFNKKGQKIRSDDPSPLYLEHFTLPENGLPDFKETSYHVDYQGVRFIIINTWKARELDKQIPWLEELLSNNPNKWTIVSFHRPIYSVGQGRDDDNTRKALLPVLDKYDVDLVLTGHDHVYARSYRLQNGEKVSDNEKGTVYVVSVSGPKMYSYETNYNDIMEKTGENVQLYQVISIKGKELEYESYTATGSLYDSFKLQK